MEIMGTEVQRGKGVGFDRIRRITGYLSNYDSFNDAKRKEERDRKKHLGSNGEEKVSA